MSTGSLLAPDTSSFCRASCNNAWCFWGYFHTSWRRPALERPVTQCPRWRQFQHKNLFFTKATDCSISVSDNFFSTSPLFVTPNVPTVVVGEDEISSRTACLLRASEPPHGCVATKLAASALSASHFEKQLRRGSGSSPPENFWIFRLKNTLFLSFEAPYPMYFHG